MSLPRRGGGGAAPAPPARRRRRVRAPSSERRARARRRRPWASAPASCRRTPLVAPQRGERPRARAASARRGRGGHLARARVCRCSRSGVKAQAARARCQRFSPAAAGPGARARRRRGPGMPSGVRASANGKSALYNAVRHPAARARLAGGRRRAGQQTQTRGARGAMSDTSDDEAEPPPRNIRAAGGRGRAHAGGARPRARERAAQCATTGSASPFTRASARSRPSAG